MLLLKCGELVLKGLNRSKFEMRLEQNLRRRLKNAGNFKISSLQSTFYVEPADDSADMDRAEEAAKKLFGIASVCRAAVCQKEFDDICARAEEYLGPALQKARSFKVTAKRADKSFPMTSPQIAVEVGGHLHDLHPHLVPDMEDPEVTVTVEIRDRYAFVHGLRQKGAGGIPVGTSGKGALLLSGGIDSPVAGWMMARRGMELSAVHFFSYPYTSEEARDKVIALARLLTPYTGWMELMLVPFTKIQEEIRDKAETDLFTVVMRRFMMRIATRLAREGGCGAVITGESLGQVASQTLEAMTVTEAVAELPVFRPVIGMDKDDIVQIARHIGTFETSVLPYEDCCTVFTPKHPVTKPKTERVLAAEAALDIENLVAEAIQNTERMRITDER